jgi:hypothetical protein
MLKSLLLQVLNGAACITKYYKYKTKGGKIMNISLSEMKDQSSKTFHKIRTLFRDQGFALNTFRNKKLRMAGCALTTTLLSKSVSDTHADNMYISLKEHIGGGIAQDRLRYLTVIHDVVGTVFDDNEAMVMLSVEQMVSRLESALSGFWSLGVVELELISLDLMRSFQSQEDTQRHKLMLVEHLLETGDWSQTVEGILQRLGPGGTRVLVHAHIVVDLGAAASGDLADRETGLRDRLKNYWSGSRQFELKKFSEQWRGKKRSLDQNLRHIANYATKCGNEELRFKVGFGRNHYEEIESQMFYEYGKQLISDDDDGSVIDVRALNANEIGFLDRITCLLMNRNKSNSGKGYLVRTR